MLPPLGADAIEQCEPIYEELPGWSESSAGVKDLDALPHNAKRYLNRLEEIVGVPIDIVSNGPERDETIILKHPFD
jgi:adenylosuccinate synthase